MSQKQKQQQATEAQVGAMQEFVELKPAAELWSSPSAQQPEAEPDAALAGQQAGAGGRNRGGSRGLSELARRDGPPTLLPPFVFDSFLLSILRWSLCVLPLSYLRWRFSSLAVDRIVDGFRGGHARDLARAPQAQLNSEFEHSGKLERTRILHRNLACTFCVVFRPRSNKSLLSITSSPSRRSRSGE